MILYWKVSVDYEKEYGKKGLGKVSTEKLITNLDLLLILTLMQSLASKHS